MPSCRGFSCERPVNQGCTARLLNMPSRDDVSVGVGEEAFDLFGYPQRLLSALMYHATRVRFRPWKNWQIRWFIRRYHVDMSEAMFPDPASYPDFNSFFTRALRPGIRPLPRDQRVVVSPADGRVSQFGSIRDDTLTQVKGLYYSLSRLLGGNAGTGSEFDGGKFVTVYLAPGDYHRVHMPLAGSLRKMVHVPGRLFSVGERTTGRVPSLFARNERVVSIFDHDLGPVAIVLIGALCVGGIEQVWSGLVTPPRGRHVEVHDYRSGPDSFTLGQADEMGRFNMGSTVVVLFGPTLRLEWAPGLALGSSLKVGERIAALS